MMRNISTEEFSTCHMKQSNNQAHHNHRVKCGRSFELLIQSTTKIVYIQCSAFMQIGRKRNNKKSIVSV